MFYTKGQMSQHRQKKKAKKSHASFSFACRKCIKVSSERSDDARPARSPHTAVKSIQQNISKSLLHINKQQGGGLKGIFCNMKTPRQMLKCFGAHARVSIVAEFDQVFRLRASVGPSQISSIAFAACNHCNLLQLTEKG